MSDSNADLTVPVKSAGALLRAARERSGIHIGLLSTTLKVPVRKLELLESDRFEELHDATFVRALALSVCRVLKCDPVPVLEALPRLEAVTAALDQVSHGVNEPFPRRGGAAVALRSPAARRAWWWVPVVLLVLAATLWWVPASWWPGQSMHAGSAASSDAATGAGVAGSPAQPSASAAPAVPSAAASAVTGFVQTVHGAPVVSAASAVAGLVSAITVTEPSWVEAADLQGRQIWARTLTPGEVVALEAGAGLRLTIGNAAATQVRWRGREVDLSGTTRDNVARLELK
jgi:cytoskeleton protein RodZ